MQGVPLGIINVRSRRYWGRIPSRMINKKLSSHILVIAHKPKNK